LQRQLTGANHRLGWGVQDHDAESAQAGDAMADNIPIHLQKATFRRLQRIAWERHTPLQRLVEEAMDEWLARQSETPANPSAN
jgi:predicted transcriptional regulator